jgi:hypothetical protein
LRAGGFICFLPGLIDGSWDDLASRLAGLPMTICFNGLPADIDRQPLPFMLTTTYWIVPATYRASENIRAVSFRTQPANEYRLEVAHDLKTELWRGRKYRADELLLEATGREIWEFTIHFTMSGRAEDEPAQAFLTMEDVGARRVYLWSPVASDAHVQHEGN